MNSIHNGNLTVEQISKDIDVSEKDVSIVLNELISTGILGRNADGSYYNAVYDSPIKTQPKTTANKFTKGDKMKSQTNHSKATRGRKKLNTSKEQRDFARLVRANKSKLFDLNEVLIHRGCEVLFAGCGSQAFRYKISVSGFSDKEPVEYPVLYLDWDDSALYDKGGLADQIKELLGVQDTPAQPQLAPTIQAQIPLEGK